MDPTTILATDISSLGYGNRVVLSTLANAEKIKVNPRNEIGKVGISYHNSLTKCFANTIEFQVPAKENPRSMEVYHLNKNSTIKWLNPQLPDGEKVNENTPNADVVAKINGLSGIIERQEQEKARRKEQDLKERKDIKASYPAKMNTHRINSIVDTVRNWFWCVFYNFTIQTWNRFRLRFALGFSEQTLSEASQIRAVAAYKQALRVPAYQTFLANNGSIPGLHHPEAERKEGESKEAEHKVRSESRPVDAAAAAPRAPITNFADLPTTSKNNYIKGFIDPLMHSQLYLDGVIPDKVKRDTSTGTSGPSTAWYRGPQEQMVVEQLTTYAAKVVIGNQPYTLINGFAVGPWATGITATLAGYRDKNATICVMGPNIPEIYATIKEQALIRGPGYPIIVGGYPPHIRAVVDLAVKEDFPLHRYNVIAVVGGESMSEDLRDLITVQKNADGDVLRTGCKQCYSSYGASDLDINIGYESEFEIELRKLCHKNPALAEELFGKDTFIPMIFHYDPLNYYIEVDKNRRGIYTCVRQDRISPRIRYELGDMVDTCPRSNVDAILKKHGIVMEHRPNTNLPLLFVWGREDSHISFRGGKVAPENLGQAIRTLDATDQDRNLNAAITHYALYQHDVGANTVTEILLEFKDDASYDRADPAFLDRLLKMLAVVNTDFVAQLASCPHDEKPVLRVFKQGQSPMAEQQTKYKEKKKQYIFSTIGTRKDEFIPNVRVLEDHSRVIKLA